jgi:hypothetical protein
VFLFAEISQLRYKIVDKLPASLRKADVAQCYLRTNEVWQVIGIRQSLGSNRLQKPGPVRLWASLRFCARLSQRTKCFKNNRICFTSLKLQQKALSDGDLQAVFLMSSATRSAGRAPSFDEVTRDSTCSSVKASGPDSSPRNTDAPSASKLHTAPYDRSQLNRRPIGFSPRLLPINAF